MKALLAAVLVALAVPSFAASPWAGRWSPQVPAPAAWQSLTSLDQALGAQMHLAALDYKGQPWLTGSWMIAGEKELSQPSQPMRFVSGPVFAVPGSDLDWALGTSWGKQWLPKLKTGLTAAPDVTRLKAIGLRNTFFGFGISYPVGG